MSNDKSDIPPPMSLLAELTYRCPLACPYCSNPVEMTGKAGEMSTETWVDILTQASKLGVLHVHFSGGEPLSRHDLPELMTTAAEADLYTNLITSGIGLTKKRLADLVARGLDHIQLSLQGLDADTADLITGYKGSFNRKKQVAEWIYAEGIPLTLNAVMHRMNLDRVDETIAVATELGARRLEIATVQFHGWALKNKAALLPTRDQVSRATASVAAARERLKGVLVIDYVPADYYAVYPKACMGGWGRIGISVTPDGTVLPCHAARTIPHLTFDNVRDRPLAEIWRASDSFNAYRGEEWMQEPCRSCEGRKRDFGGCRCQALALVGDAAAGDPVCSKSPHRSAVDAVLEETVQPVEAAVDLVYRPAP